MIEHHGQTIISLTFPNFPDFSLTNFKFPTFPRFAGASPPCVLTITKFQLRNYACRKNAPVCDDNRTGSREWRLDLAVCVAVNVLVPRAVILLDKVVILQPLAFKHRLPALRVRRNVALHNNHNYLHHQTKRRTSVTKLQLGTQHTIKLFNTF